MKLADERPGQAAQMTIAGDGPDAGHWYSPAAVREMLADERERRTSLARDFGEYLYRVASQVPFEHADWASQRGAALLAALTAEQGMDDRCMSPGPARAWALLRPDGSIDEALVSSRREDCEYWTRADGERQSGWAIAEICTVAEADARVVAERARLARLALQAKGRTDGWHSLTADEILRGAL